MQHKSNGNAVYSCKYHLVWCTKYRRPVLIDGVDDRLETILAGVAAETGSELFEVEVTPDHVHLLAEVGPQLGIHRFVKLAKGRSSRILREEFAWLRSRIPTLWTHSYFVTTLGDWPEPTMDDFLEEQRRK